MEKGAGNAGCTLAPAVSCAVALKESAHEHTGEAEAVRHPLRGGLTAYTVLSLVTGFLATIAGVMRSIITDLTPASGRRDHTILPYANAPFVVRRLSRPPHPAPRS